MLGGASRSGQYEYPRLTRRLGHPHYTRSRHRMSKPLLWGVIFGPLPVTQRRPIDVMSPYNHNGAWFRAATPEFGTLALFGLRRRSWAWFHVCDGLMVDMTVSSSPSRLA